MELDDLATNIKSRGQLQAILVYKKSDGSGEYEVLEGQRRLNAFDILNHGLHLFTEKPMAPTVKQGECLVNAANENDCLYVAGFMRRHDEGVQIAKIQKLNILINHKFYNQR